MKTKIGVGKFWVISLGIVCSGCDSNKSERSALDSAMDKGREGRAMEMTGDEMDAFREKNLRDSQEHKNSIRNGLTREEKAMQDYEDAMILKGETKSNPHYEELQRRAQESR